MAKHECILYTQPEWIIAHICTRTQIQYTHTYIYIYIIPAYSRVIRHNIILLHWTFTSCGHLKARRCENCFEMNARPLCFSRTVSTGQVWKQVEKLLVAWSCLRMHWQAAGFFCVVFFLLLFYFLAIHDCAVRITWAGIFVLWQVVADYWQQERGECLVRLR